MRKTVYAALGVLLPSLALAQADNAADKYPQRPIRIITGSVGSTSDLSARIIAQKLGERWGQQVVVDNRPGAGGIIGTDIAAKSAPDGYTLLIGHVGTHASAPALYSKLPYDPVRDFEPVTNVTNVAIVLVVHPSVPATNLKDFVAYAKTRPGALNNGSPGNGTSGHLTGELFNIVTQTKLLHIPYKGAGPALNAVVMGESHLSFLSTATAQGQVKAGRLRALAVLRATRFSGTPDVPSSVEAGFPGLESNAWFGLFAPAKTPKSIITKVNNEVMRAFKLPEVATMLTAQGAEDATCKPEEFGAYVKSEIAKWGKVVKVSGAKLD